MIEISAYRNIELCKTVEIEKDSNAYIGLHTNPNNILFYASGFKQI